MSDIVNTDSLRFDNDDVKAWLAIRKQAALRIDPRTAEVMWVYGETLDPYGVYDLLPEEQQVGRIWFARSPDSDVWVAFRDLPKTTRDELWRKIESGQLDSFDSMDWLFA
jgi:hypothetical protein